MKHILSLLLLLMCCVGFVSCGDDDAIVNNLPTERLSALREQILDIIERS